MYFIDELNGGSVYKFTSAASLGEIKSGRVDYFDAGQTFVLRVGDGPRPTPRAHTPGCRSPMRMVQRLPRRCHDHRQNG